MIACSVFLLLIAILIGIEYRLAHPTVPPGIQRSECLKPRPEGESGQDWLARLGGHITRYPNAQWQANAFTVADIAQGRDLNKYEKLELRDPQPRHPWENRIPVFAQARTFLFQHWHDRKRAYLILTVSSVDHTGTSHIFVEPDDSGRWRVYWRQLDRRELIDEPTAYWVLWVMRQGDGPAAPISSDRAGDPFANQIEFRDVCGEKIRVL